MVSPPKQVRLPPALWLLPSLCLLAACGGGTRYAGGGYDPGSAVYPEPGPPGDPWRPYVRQASDRFTVPQQWIRAVMRQESGGHEYSAWPADHVRRRRHGADAADAGDLRRPAGAVRPRQRPVRAARQHHGRDRLHPADVSEVWGAGVPGRLQCGAAAARGLPLQRAVAAERDHRLRRRDRAQPRHRGRDERAAGRICRRRRGRCGGPGAGPARRLSSGASWATGGATGGATGRRLLARSGRRVRSGRAVPGAAGAGRRRPGTADPV